MEVFFENSDWIMGWTKGKTRVRMESKKGKGFATAYLVGKPFDYGDMDMFRRAPRIAYTNEYIVPAYIRDKVTMAFSRGQRWR
jgi:hypothetical protein